MANRPVFIPKLTVPYYFIWNGEFEWNRGLSASQKQKNVTALHKAFTMCYPSKKVLEISSKSMQEGGVELSAFSLKKLVPSLGKAVPVENVYQAGKYFAKGGPYLDLLETTPRAAKGDERLRNSGPVRGFRYEGYAFPLYPTNAFYDYLYINALCENPSLSKILLEYDAFTDVEFNREKSLNCQARAAAIFVSLHQLGLLNKVKTPEDFTALFGKKSEISTPKPQEEEKTSHTVKEGDKIIHSVWGQGKVVAVDKTRVKIFFPSVDEKSLAHLV